MRILLLLLLLVITDRGEATSLRNQIRSLVGANLSGPLSLAIITNINKVDEHGRNALHHAVELGDLSLVEFLTTNGVSTKIKDRHGLLPLDYAIGQAEKNKSSQQALIVSHVLEKTWGINGRDEKGWPPINWAIVAGNLPRIKELVDKGVSANYSVSYRRANTFELAELMQNQEIIDYLLSVWGTTILYRAIRQKNYTKVRETLESGFDVNTVDEYGATVLHRVVSRFQRQPEESRRSEEIVNLLLEFGANPNATNNKGQTPLHLINRQPANVVRSLLEAGGDVNATDNLDKTPLHTSDWGSHEVGRILLEAGADINAIDKFGQTPLHIVDRKEARRTDFLLRAGADPNAIDNEGRTPLHNAAVMAIAGWVHGNDMVKVLQKAGADPGIANKEGRTPLDVLNELYH